MTVLDKLHRKGWLSREPVGRAYAYRPVQSRESYCAALMTEVLGQSQDPRTTLLRFVEAIPRDVAAQLEQALREREAGE
jgi:predicted transcriptional regulator